MKIMLETLIGVKRTQSRTHCKPGVLGEVSAYFGVVEAQGRGTLHAHFLLWLANAPTADLMSKLLEQLEFRTKLENYLKTTIRAARPGFMYDEQIKSLQKVPHIAYSRPPDTTDANYVQARLKMEKNLARAFQVHMCDTRNCLKIIGGERKCKRRAPFQLSKVYEVDSDGNCIIQRGYGFMNCWVPPLCCEIRCNHDMKFITNGPGVRNLLWYISKYQTKRSKASYNRSALEAKSVARYGAEKPTPDGIRERSRRLVFSCQNILNKEQEHSGPQVMQQIMNFGDVFKSHNYVSIYWTRLERAIEKAYPELRGDAGNATQRRQVGEETMAVAQEDSQCLEVSRSLRDEESLVTLEFLNNSTVFEKSQLLDYALRGIELEEFSFYMFSVHTYDTLLSPQERAEKDARMAEDGLASGAGQCSNRVQYLQEHPRHGISQRYVRSVGHNTLPDVVGPFFPSHKHDGQNFSDRYNASMLSMLKPWRVLKDLKLPSESWHEAFSAFMSTAVTEDKDFAENVRYYHDSSGAAREQAALRAQEAGQESGENGRKKKQVVQEDDMEVDDYGANHDEDVDSAERCTEEGLAKLIEESESRASAEHARETVKAAKAAGFFQELSEGKRSEYAASGAAEGDDFVRLAGWQQQMADFMLSSESVLEEGESASQSAGKRRAGAPPRVERLSDIDKRIVSPDGVEALEGVDPSCLFSEQREVYDMVEQRLMAEEAGGTIDQLLLLVTGEGGVGKSKVIQTITDLFVNRGCNRKLAKGAFTGIAASIIGGKTLHTLFGLTSEADELGVVKAKELSAFWSQVRFLIIDEISMVSKKVFRLVERRLSRAKQQAGFDFGNRPFGGVHVLLFGDFHQFKPVLGQPLFRQTNSKETDKEKQGRAIFLQFEDVIRLTKQVRIEDVRWLEVLRNARIGAVSPTQLEHIRSLVIGSPNCPPTDLTKPPWTEATFITTRHTARIRWNNLAIEQHCWQTGVQMYESPALDTLGGMPLTLEQQYKMYRGSKGGSRGKESTSGSKTDRAGLPRVVRLAVGMKVMVTYNVNTELDIANGARGTVYKIVLHEDEPACGNGMFIQLKYTPRVVLVKLDRTKVPQLAGLPLGVIPIVPLSRDFKLEGRSGPKVARLQLPLTAAYAFTDYRGQGQTIPYVVADLSTPPTGGISPFSAYVTLSRSRKSENIRLLRDFNNKLFTEHPDDDLAKEDPRLDQLARETKERLKFWKSLYV